MTGKKISFVTRWSPDIGDTWATGTIESVFTSNQMINNDREPDTVRCWLLISYEGSFYERPALECKPLW